MEVILIRHTEVSNPGKKCYGKTDMPLLNFRQQAEALKKTLLSFVPDYKKFTCISSPASRCTVLASFLFKSKFWTEHRLSELDFGRWEGVPWSDLPSSQLNRWMYGYVWERPGGGESFDAMCLRVGSLLLELNDSRIVLISHAGPIRCVLAHYLNKDKYVALQQEVGFGSVFQIKFYNSPAVYPLV